MKLKNILTAIILAGVIIIGIIPSADSASLPYSRTRREINAGVLVTPNSGKVSTYLFMVMDWRSDMKPRGWEFVNPLAPRRAGDPSDPVVLRWGLRPGTVISKYHGAYWEVDLTSASSANLAKFDVLYLTALDHSDLTVDQQDKLRRFVDGGGLLWIDNSGGMDFQGFFINDFQFTTASGTPYIPAHLSHHPVVSTPFRITSPEISAVGRRVAGLNPGIGGGFNPNLLLPIALLNSAGKDPYIAGSEYGSGRVVATAGWVGGNISEAATRGITPSYIDQSNSNMFMASPAALKLAYNIISWASSFTGFHKNPRHTGYSLESLNPALVLKWKLPYAPPANAESSPVVYKNVFFYVGMDGDATLFAIDGAPEQDLDGDGNPDDGMPNPPGVDADIIYGAKLGAPGASSPIFFTMQDPDNKDNAIDVVAVYTAGGTVFLFHALPVDNFGRLAANNPPMASFSIPPPGDKIYPPTYHNGWLYVAAGDGRMYMINPVLDYVREVTELPQPPTGGLKSAPVVGFVHNKERGSEVTMVYSVAPPGDTGGGNPTTNDRLYGFPMYVANERLQFVSATGSIGTYNTFLVQAGATAIERNYPKPRVWFRNALNNLVELDVDREVSFSGPGVGLGQMQINFGAHGVTPSPNLPVFASYGLDYDPGIQLNYRSPRVLYPFPPEINTLTPIPGGTTPMVRAENSLVFGPNGLLYIPTQRSSSDSCGSVYAFAHDTGTVSSSSTSMTPKLKWAYHLHGGDPLQRYINPNYIPAKYLIDRDVNGTDGDRVNDMLKPVAYDIVGSRRVPLQGLQVKSSPAVVGDKLFVTVTSGQSSPDVAGGALLCFKANPDFVIKVQQVLRDETGKKLKVRLWQPDPSVPSTGRSPLEEAVTLPENMVDYDTGTIVISDFGNGILRTHGGTTPQAITNTFTPALPVWVIVEQTMVPPDQVELTSWNNLLWFFVPQHPDKKCSGIHSSPVVMGEQVYFTCDDGYIYAIDIETGKTNGESLGYHKEDEKYIKWKDKIFDGGGSGFATSMAGANRLLGVVGGDGLYGFENPTTLIADNRRIVEVDGSANITWACDSTSQIANLPGAQFDSAVRQRMPINRPALARNFGPSDYLVVDSGNNQVLRMDKGGFVSSKISKFYVPTEKDLGGQSLMFSGEPDRLRGPVDALLWVNQEMWKDPKDGAVKRVTAIHWLIADTGNFRIIDVVERFDDQRVPQCCPGNEEKLPELNWVTKTEVSQKSFAFNSVQLVQVPGPNGLPVEEIWAAVANYSGAAGQVGGSILRIPYRERVNAQDPFLWQYTKGHDAEVLVSHLSIKGDIYPLANPKFARMVIGQSANYLLLCEDRGVFLVQPVDKAPAIVQWGITSVDMGLTTYSSMMRNISVWDGNAWMSVKDNVEVPLKAVKVQRLPNSLLITNNYTGTAREGTVDYRFSGEVFEVKLDNNGMPTNEIIWYAPRIEDETAGNGGPLTSRRQKFEQSSPLEQPMSGERILW